MNPNPTTYAEAIRKTKKQTGLNEVQLDYIFNFIVNDPFWKPNCQSPAGLLRPSKNGVRKIDNVLAKIKDKNKVEIAMMSWVKRKEAEEANPELKPRKEYAF